MLGPTACAPAEVRPCPRMLAGLAASGGPDPGSDEPTLTPAEIRQKDNEILMLKKRLAENEMKLEHLIAALSDRHESSTIMELLESTEVPPVMDQYNTKFRQGASFILRSRDVEVEQVRSSAIRRLNPTDEKSDILVISGPTGAGKTRLGFEALRLLSDRDMRFVGRLEKVLGLPCVTVALYIDFNNGCGYQPGVDSDIIVFNMGLRLAASSLGITPVAVFEKNGNCLDGLSPDAVLDAIVAGALRRAGASLATASPVSTCGTTVANADGGLSPAVVVLVVHFDEYQFYLKKLKAFQGYSANTARQCFKVMVSAINNWAAENGVVFLPIVSGTPLDGLDLLVTEKLTEVPLYPSRLDVAAAVELVADVITEPVDLLHLRPGLIKILQNQDEARVALADTDYRPRFLVDVGAAVRAQLNMSGAVTLEDLSLVDWGAAVSQAVARLPLVGLKRDHRDMYKTLARLALGGIPVRSVFPISAVDRTDAENYVADAAEDGIVELCGEENGYVTVRLPLVQLRSWGVLGVVPPSLMSPTLLTWQQAEQVFAVCLSAALWPGLRSRAVTVRNLLPGALGGPQLANIELILDQSRQVYREAARSITQKTPILAADLIVVAEPLLGGVKVSVDLQSGVFLSCAGNPVVDLRCTVPTRLGKGRRGQLHIYGQSRQSLKDKEVSEKEIAAFYTSALAATASLRSAGDDVLFIFFTNRKLNDAAAGALTASYFEAHPCLCVVSADQLGGVVPPFLLTRFQTATKQTGEFLSTVAPRPQHLSGPPSAPSMTGC